MRVIAGIRRGFRLFVTKSSATRPTTDSTKEFIFNVAASSFEGCVVLDLFAGTGSLGIEALSRGAAKAVFVESSRDACKVLIQNLKKCKFESLAEVVVAPADRAVKILGRRNETFDFIFADPPYDSNLAVKTMEWVNMFQLLKKDGLLTVEHRDAIDFDNSALSLVRSKKKGDTTVSFYAHGN